MRRRAKASSSATHSLYGIGSHRRPSSLLLAAAFALLLIVPTTAGAAYDPIGSLTLNPGGSTFNAPHRVAVDTTTGNLFIPEAGTPGTPVPRVLAYETHPACTPACAAPLFSFPSPAPLGVAVDSENGALYTTHLESNEKQLLEVVADGGFYKLSFDGQTTGWTGSGAVTCDGSSTSITGVTTSTGSIAVRQAVRSTPGSCIKPNTTITACSPSCAAPTSLTLSQATESNAGTGTVSLASDLTIKSLPTALNATQITTQIREALEKLPNVGTGNVAVTGPGAASPVKREIEFKGTLGALNVQQLACDGSSLTGAAPACNVATSLPGGPPGMRRYLPVGSHEDPTGYAEDTSFTSPTQGAGASQIGSFGSGSGPAAKVAGIAVDPGGDVWIGDPGQNKVCRIAPTGAIVGTCFDGSTSGAPFTDVNDVAVNSAGQVIVADRPTTTTNRVLRFGDTGAFLGTLGPDEVPNGRAAARISLAVDTSADEVFVSSKSEPDTSAPSIYRFDVDDVLIESIPFPAPGPSSTWHDPLGLASAGDAGARLYPMVNSKSFGFDSPVLQVFEADLFAPVVVLDPVGGISATEATFTGSVNPEGSDLTKCRFEYLTEAAYQANPPADRFNGAERLDCVPGAEMIGDGVDPVSVEATAADLEPDTGYRARLFADKPGKSAASTEGAFATDAIPPTFGGERAWRLGATAATLVGTVNPNNNEVTACEFEYVTEVQHGLDGFASADSTPCVRTDPGVDEEQRITVKATAGQFKLSFGGDTTGNLAFNASAATVQAALRTLPSIGSVGVRVSGGPGDAIGSVPYMVTFQNALGGQDVEQIAVSDGSIPLSAEVGVSIFTAKEGAAGPPVANEEQRITVKATAGQFKLSFGGDTTGNFAFNASAATVQEALWGLPSIGSPNVNVGGGPGDATGSAPYTVTFTGALGAKDVGQLSASVGTTPLDGSAGVAVATDTAGAAPVTAIGAGADPVPVHTRIEGLEPSSQYRFRILAENGIETELGNPVAVSPARVFATHPVSSLPKRAYELVSAEDTNGLPVELAGRIASADGERIAYFTFLAAPGAEHGGVGGQFVASRLADGTWAQSFANPSNDATAPHTAFSSNLAFAVFVGKRSHDPGDQNDDAVGSGPSFDAYLRQPGKPGYTWLSCTPDPPSIACPPTGGPAQTEKGEVDRAYHVSTDGERVLFGSRRRLLESDAAAAPSSSLYEWDEGELRLVGVSPGGSEGFVTGSYLGSGAGPGNNPWVYGNGVLRNAVSRDGNRVVFQSDLAPTAADETHLYVRINGEETVEASSGLDSTPRSVNFWGADEDVESVFFTSSSPLTSDSKAPDTPISNGTGQGGAADLFRYSVPADGNPADGRLIDVTPTPGGAGVNQVLWVSDDGRRVYFTARKALAPGAREAEHCNGLDANPSGVSMGPCNLYLAEFEGPDDDTAEIGLVSRAGLVLPTGLAPAIAWEGARQVSGNSTGSVLAFRSLDSLVAGARTSGAPQVYVYDAERDELSCASCPADGSAASPRAASLIPGGLNPGAREVIRVGDVGGVKYTMPHAGNVSEDGTVVFQTPTPLAPFDTNGAIDVYEFSRGRVGLVSSGTDPMGAHVGPISADGRTIFFSSTKALAPGATNGVRSIYAARIGGGVEVVVDPPCTGEDCKPVATAQPNYAAPATSALAGGGNLAPSSDAKPPRCRKGKVRRGGRCVTRKKRARKRASDENGRARR